MTDNEFKQLIYDACSAISITRVNTYDRTDFMEQEYHRKFVITGKQRSKEAKFMWQRIEDSIKEHDY